MSEWISVKDKLPEIDTKVLIFYTIAKTDSKNKPTGGHHEYFEIAQIESITTTKTSSGVNTSVEWRDSDWNYVSPTYWMPLPKPPKETS